MPLTISTISILIKKSFRTATRSPNTNFDYLFLQKIFIKNVLYVYFDKSIFQDKYVHVVFTFSNSTI